MAAGVIRAPDRCEELLRQIVERGAYLLDAGGSALDVVTACVTLLEDDPLDNAGRGSVLNADGVVVCDASIMDGRILDAGAVAGVRGVRNPILLARAVMEKSQHVFLIGEGAARFAREQGILFEADEYFLTKERILELVEAKKEQAFGPVHSQTNEFLARHRRRRSARQIRQSRGRDVDRRYSQPAVRPRRRFRSRRRWHIRRQLQLRGLLHGRWRTILRRPSLARTVALFVECRGMRAEEAAKAAIPIISWTRCTDSAAF